MEIRGGQTATTNQRASAKAMQRSMSLAHLRHLPGQASTARPCDRDRAPKAHLDAIFALAEKHGKGIDIAL